MLAHATARELDAFVRESPIQRRPIADAVAAAAAELPAGARVLDAGAGQAPYRPLFPHCDYVTQDWPGSVHPGGRAADVVADLHALPLPSASFDFVLCTEVLEHVAEPQRVLGELHRILRPGGAILLTAPFVGELHEEPHDHFRYTSHGLAGLLERSGFAVREVAPLTGYWSTLAHVLRHAGLATRPRAGRAPIAARIATQSLLLASGVLALGAPRLDRLDRRHALPLGWACRAIRAPAEA